MMDASDVVPAQGSAGYCSYVVYWSDDGRKARMGGMPYLWCRTTNLNGDVPTIERFHDLHDESAMKKRKVVVDKTVIVNRNTRHDNLHGANLCPMHAPRHPCKLGSYFRQPSDDMIIDYNNVAIASMIAVHGDNVAMAKLVVMHAVQSCYVEREMDWSGIGPRISLFANAIMGGVWSGGVHQWPVDCLQLSEIYVAYVEDKAIWMGKNPGSSVIHFDDDGDCVGL